MNKYFFMSLLKMLFLKNLYKTLSNINNNSKIDDLDDLVYLSKHLQRILKLYKRKNIYKIVAIVLICSVFVVIPFTITYTRKILLLARDLK